MVQYALNRGKRHIVLAADIEKHQVRIKGDNQRIRWFPAHCYDQSDLSAPVLATFHLEDPIRPQENIFIEVTVELSNGDNLSWFFQFRISPTCFLGKSDALIFRPYDNYIGKSLCNGTHNFMLYNIYLIMFKSICLSETAYFLSYNCIHEKILLNVNNSSLQHIIIGCYQESQAQNQTEKGYCYELFRRALDLNDQEAWVALIEQYQNLINFWIRKGTTRSLDEDILADLQQNTLERFWRTLSKKNAPQIKNKFNHVGAILKYLNKCAISSCVEWNRVQQRNQRIHEKLQTTTNISFTQNVIEEKSSLMQRQSHLQTVKDWLQTANLTDEEQLLYRLSYRDGLKPSAIAKQYPAIFPTAKDVYRVKLRLIKRIQRAIEQ